MSLDDRRLYKARKLGVGIGLVKGMAVTLKHLFKHNTVIQYPDEKQDLGPRTRGVIALKEENCTVCMLCARECPDWCIYIDSHKETLPPKREGGRPRKRNVLDRFAIDYALCMYCGICVEVCPYDALFWSREFEYAEYDIRELTHEKERLSDWMSTVLPPPPLDEGAEQPGRPAALPASGNGGAPALQPAAQAAIPAATATATATAPAPAAPAAGATTPASAPTLAPEDTTVEADRLPPAPAPAPARSARRRRNRACRSRACTEPHRSPRLQHRRRNLRPRRRTQTQRGGQGGVQRTARTECRGAARGTSTGLAATDRGRRSRVSGRARGAEQRAPRHRWPRRAPA